MKVPIIRPSSSNIDVHEFINKRQGYIMQQAFLFGAVLFRGWDIKDSNEFKTCVDSLKLKHYDYIGGAAPRTKISDDISSSQDTF